MTDLQFYPTPEDLARRAWRKFKQHSRSRVLEPSAGEGHLADAMPGIEHRGRGHIDVIEIDVSKHPLLRQKGYRVVGLDFLEFEGGQIYDSIILNPPFAEGCQHVLKAWDCLWTGEVVAIINAETLRNPFSMERKRLAALVGKHGSVEFIQDAFRGEGVAREAEVEVALIHLEKPAASNEDWIGPAIDALARDRTEEREWALPNELALPANFVSSQVRAFNLAVTAMREAVKAEAVAAHYAARIGRTMVDLTNDRADGHLAGAESPGAGIRSALAKRYDELKDRAWASVLRSTETLSKLSAKVQKQAEAQFEQIKALEFTETNVYGFLLGLVQSQPEMVMNMMEEVFDAFSRYHSDNAVLYRGWKSNDRHRTCGLRLKTTRFILPGHAVDSCRSGVPWDTRRLLADFDRVFAILDGVAAPEVGLVSLAEQQFQALRAGARVRGTYFDLRWYHKAGTIHFFPRRRDLVDRLNRFVGRRRGWLPPEGERVSDAFWLAYEQAEKLDPEVRAHATRAARSTGRYYSRWSDPVEQLFRGHTEEYDAANALVLGALEHVLTQHGLLDALEDHTPASLALPAPATKTPAASGQAGTASELAKLAIA